MNFFQNLIQRQVRTLVGSSAPQLDAPKGDPGLLGPESVAWRVHGDFTAMMIGGVTALLLQMLHPKALAGVWDHSGFRDDMIGRLKRTAQYIAGTTYGPTDEAEKLLDRVKLVHDQVEGTLPDGSSYSANDPHLLTWVHVAEVSSFLQAYLRYCDPHLSRLDQDRYFAEVALFAKRLGAKDVPVTRTDVDAYLTHMQPELRYDARTREVASVLLSQPAPTILLRPFRDVTMDAAIDLLPSWAATMHGLDLSSRRRQLARVGARSIRAVMKPALRDTPATRARRRVEGQSL
ncbi:oxygenase MpaB family protein [Tianweitania sp.]|uniref:oxygenase MpaB family protein n=1 Tax=Tianweitania sp. TaxID=2021634 RepID=UPI00289739EA|nr:oxygenase MpaB family protein [Tianweitania sp.]